MRIVVALGGNALLRRGEPADADDQRRNVAPPRRRSPTLAAEHEVVVTHGNGPQVGLLALQDDAYDAVAPYPLDVLGAESEGMIGYLLEQELVNALGGRPRGDPADPGHRRPRRPGASRARRSRSARSTTARPPSGSPPSAAGRSRPTATHWRRVVASPEPRSIVELQRIRLLVDGRRARHLRRRRRHPRRRRPRRAACAGVEAVIDKDLAAALLAAGSAPTRCCCSPTSPASRRAGDAGRARHQRATPEELRTLRSPPGSMGPKVEAACRFAEQTGGLAAIGALADARAILPASAGRWSRRPSASPAGSSMRSGTPDRRMTSAAIAIVAIVALYLALPALAGVDDTLGCCGAGTPGGSGSASCWSSARTPATRCSSSVCSDAWTASACAAAGRSRSPAWQRRGCWPPRGPEASH